MGTNFMRPLLVVVAIGAAYPLHAQAQLAPLAQHPSQPGQMNLQVDPLLDDIVVETDTNHVPGDGRASVAVTVRLLDAQGQLLKGLTFINADSNGGRIVDPAAAPGARLGLGRERLLRGVRIEVTDGVARFMLVAPPHAQEVKLSVSSGALQALGEVSFVTERRPLLVTGLAEGVLGRRSGTSGGAQRFDDGFEQSLTHWSRQFSGGKNSAAARLAFFAKGDIGADRSLTAAYDSDKAPRSRLLRELDPERFYPVYGDEAITGFDARSSERLYLRVDQRKNYLMYGDFITGAEFSQLAGGASGVDAGLHKLGQYNRSATGMRAHHDEGKVKGNVFAVHDSLRQVVEEYQANGTSGPFAGRSNNAIQNSDKVELLVRDKNQANLVKRVITLQRYVDYTFEPFSGRILFNQAIATLSEEGDPQSIRMTYEVDQGGEKFWVAGADAALTLTDAVTVGASVVEDRNPDAPYQLHSVAAQVMLGQRTRVVAEVARSRSTSHSADGLISPTPTGRSGELLEQREGSAARIELRHESEPLEARAWWQQAGPGFNNTGAGLAPGYTDAGASAKWRLSQRMRVYAEAVHSDDEYTDASRQGQRVGLQYLFGDKVNLDLSLRHMQEDGSLAPNSTIAPNTAPPGSPGTTGGGFFGSLDPAGLDTMTGLPMTTLPSGRPYLGMQANTARAGVQWRATDRLSVSADAEHSIDGADQHRYGAGVQYTSAGRGRWYARAETQRALASSYSLNPADRSNSVVAGVDTGYMPGGTVFSEYRLRDSADFGFASEREAQLASGLRNSFQLRPGVSASTGIEYVRVLGGKAQEAVALTGAIDYRTDPLWSASAKLEYRKLFDREDLLADQSQDQWLSTLTVARKLSDDWTFLARNYLLYQRNRADTAGVAMGNTLQDRAQLGFAWRPLARNDINALARYEYKTVRDRVRAEGEDYQANIVSAHGDYQPNRAWWMTGRLAAKRNTDHKLPVADKRYTAAMASGRVVRELGSKWSVGALGSVLFSGQGDARQYAFGAEVGYRLATNLYVALGHNLSGFKDKDLAGDEYTARGTFLRLRYKFDENSLTSRR